MATAAPVRLRRLAAADISLVRQLVLLSAIFLLVQVAGTDYGDAGHGPAIFWFVAGVVLLWFVYSRRSRVARGIAVVGSLVGAVVYTPAIIDNGGVHAAVLAVAYLGQALPLLAGPVQRHVQTRH